MKKFLKDMLSNSAAVSSKRVLGLIGYVSAIVFIALWAREIVVFTQKYIENSEIGY